MKLITTITLMVAGIALLLAMSFDHALLAPTETGANPVEIGQVKWIRNLDEGLAKAKKTKKDVFLLFQEVPG